MPGQRPDLHAPAGAPSLIETADADSLATLFSRRIVFHINGLNAGFCQLCGRYVDATLDRTFWADMQNGDAPLGVLRECRACGNDMRGILGTTVFDHPAVTAFLPEHDVALQETHFWDHGWLFEPHAEVVSEDRLRVAVTVTAGEDAVTVTLDEHLDPIPSTTDGPSGSE